MPKKKRYAIIEKMSTVWKLRDQSMNEVSEETGIPVSTIRNWRNDYDDIRIEYYQYLDDEAKHRILVAQYHLMEKLNLLISALDPARIDKAPLNQIASAISSIIDRYLKIQDAKYIEATNNQNNTQRIEYYDDLTGKITESPPWAEDDFESSGAFYSGVMRETLWQDGASENHGDRVRDTGRESLVARADLSDSESSLARFEAFDEERDWYQD